LYYSVASSPDLGNDAWHNLSEDEKRNSLWSVLLTAGGDFDLTGVRREFILPDFFANPEDVARAGHSRPVSDITFPACSGRAVMLVAERGGLRNLGLGQENAFATPSESRTIRYELDQGGRWHVAGRYDIGMYDALVPETATGDTPASPASLLGPYHAYMVDIEVNIDPSGNVITESIARNDATTIGDISIYQVCPIENASYSTNYPLIPAQV